MSGQIFQGLIQALTVAAVLGLFKLYKDFIEWKTKTEPLLDWWRQTSIDALKIATNPTSERLTELAEKYIASTTGKGQITMREKQELIDGLRAVLNDPNQNASKRQSASMSLRFIETREGLTSRAANH